MENMQSFIHSFLPEVHIYGVPPVIFVLKYDYYSSTFISMSQAIMKINLNYKLNINI